jgi:hypothetical protein
MVGCRCQLATACMLLFPAVSPMQLYPGVDLQDQATAQDGIAELVRAVDPACWITPTPCSCRQPPAQLSLPLSCRTGTYDSPTRHAGAAGHSNSQ